MNLRRLVATSALVIGAMGVWTGTAYAAPETGDTTPAAGAETISWNTRVEAGGVATTVDAGFFKVSDDGKTVELLDPADAVVLTLPLTLNLNGIEFPIEPTFTEEGRTVTLIPNMLAPNLLGETANLGENNVASPAEDSAATQAFAGQLALASGIGGLVGTAIGAAAGCIITFAAGCLPGLVTGAGIGGVVGTIAAGGPTLVVAGVDYFNTLQAAPGTSKFAVQPVG